MIDCRPGLAQGFRVETKTPPSVVGAGTFVSLEAKFTIALPQNHNGFRPLSLDTPAGRATGDAFNWTMKEGSFVAGYLDAPRPMDDTETSKEVFTSIREGLKRWAESQKGTLVSDREMRFDTHPALEVKLELPTHRTWQRFYLISRRLYQVTLVLKPEQAAYEAVAVKVLDSFKVLSDEEVAAAMKTRAAEAEPSPLPQEPVVPRAGSDAADNGLGGSVKTVFQEDEDLSGKWSVQGRKPVATEYYDKRGNLTKREFYDYKGNLFEVMVFGYLDGARVSRRKSIEREYNPPPVMMAAPPGATRPKSDPRFSNKFTFQYDDKNRLTEKAWFLSNGELTIRYVYKYSGNQREEFVYTSDGSLNQHYLATLDNKGNEIEQTTFEARDGSIRSKHKYTYEFDAQGNWIKRITLKWASDNRNHSMRLSTLITERSNIIRQL